MLRCKTIHFYVFYIVVVILIANRVFFNLCQVLVEKMGIPGGFDPSSLESSEILRRYLLCSL